MYKTSPILFSTTRFANYAGRVFGNFLKNLKTYMLSLGTLQRTFIRSDQSKSEEAALMKTKICNVKFLAQLCWLVDVYKVNQLQVINTLPHERLQKFEKSLAKLEEMKRRAVTICEECHNSNENPINTESDCKWSCLLYCLRNPDEFQGILMIWL